MTLSDRLSDAFDRGLRDGVDSLSGGDRGLYAIQDFLASCEMDGLLGYFYNRLPEPASIAEAEAAMRGHGLHPLADLLGQARALFDGYDEATAGATWGEIPDQFDPDGRLAAISDRIDDLDDHGLGDIASA